MTARPGFKSQSCHFSVTVYSTYANCCYVPSAVLGPGHVVVMQTDGPYSSWHILMEAYLLGLLLSYMMLGQSPELHLSIVKVK